MSEQGWLKREMEIVQCEVATWPSWKRGEGMDEVKRYKLFQDVRYDDGAFVIPAGQVVIREADYDVLRDERDRLKREKDGAYLERNRVVAALAKLFPSGIARTSIEGWSEDWHGCVYIDLPTGQVSWHYHDSHAHLFDGIPPYRGTWDGHSTEEKYQRVAALTPAGGGKDGLSSIPK